MRRTDTSYTHEPAKGYRGNAIAQERDQSIAAESLHNEIALLGNSGDLIKVALPGVREVQKSTCYQEFLIRLANCEHCENWKSGKVEEW